MIKHITFSIIGTAIAISGFSQALNTPTNADIAGFNNQAITYHQNSEDKLPTVKMADESLKHKLDSFVYYGYNESTGEWENKSFKKSFAYDNSLNDTLILTSVWDVANHQWRDVSKETTKYDEQNNKISYEQHLISRSKKRTDYTYNSNNKLTSTTESSWLFDEEKWLDIKKTVNTYNTEGVLLADTLYNKYTDSDDWVPYGKIIYSYNVAGELLADTTYSKEKNAIEWELFDKNEYEYSDGYLEQTTRSVWNNDSARFIPHKKTQIIYDEDEWFVLETNEYEWNKTRNEWEIINALAFGTDDDNLINTRTKKTWEYDTTTVLETFTFDYSVTNTTLILPAIIKANENVIFHHQVTSSQWQRHNAETNEMEKFRETKYYYSTEEIPTGLNPEPVEPVVVFPNPVKESFYINLPGYDSPVPLTIFDINGKKILTESIMSGESINVSSLKSGIYFYSVGLNQEYITGKFIKD